MIGLQRLKLTRVGVNEVCVRGLHLENFIF